MALGRGNIEIDVSARVDTQGIVRQVNDAQRQINRSPISLKLDEKGFRQPLGRISGDIAEFQKSLDASVARTLAFGAAVGVINSVADAFKGMVKNAAEVEKALTDINVILNLSSESLVRFSNDLFQVAKNTGQTFNAVSEAAVELSRQGLGAEETLKRINDAMILTRLSGMDAAKSVETLTAAVNGFGAAALTTTELVNKLATVDAAFAVSTEDLSNALARAGSTAQGAKVSLDELLAAVTSVQQQTARGGAVIGNAFKSIFTRIQRSGVREALEEIGVATTDASGNIRGAIDIIKDYATVYSSLTDAQRAYTDELVAGVFQINNFKALVKDLGSNYSIYERALKQSNNATDEAIRRNEELQSTLSALINEAAVNVKQLSASLGELVATPAIENLLKIFNKLSGALAGALEGDGIIKNIFEGIGRFISGPGLVIISVAFIKLFKFISSQAGSALKEIFNIGAARDKIVDAEAKIGYLLQNNKALYEAITNEALDNEKKQELVLNTIKAQNQAYKQQQNLISNLARTPSIRTSLSGGNAASGYIPNFANGVEGAIASEKEAIRAGTGGASKSAKPKVLKNFPMGGGKRETIVANTDEVIVPNYGGGEGSAIFNKDMIKKSGGAPQGAIPVSRGFVPNFIKGKKRGGAGPNATSKIGFLGTEAYKRAGDFFDGEKPTLDFERVVGGIGIISAKGKSGSITKSEIQNPTSSNFLGASGTREIIDQIGGSKLNDAEKSELVKRLGKKGKVRFSNIGSATLSGLGEGQTAKQLAGRAGSINDVIGPYIANATAAVAQKIYGNLFGDEVKAQNLVGSVFNAATTQIDKIATVSTEGSILEAAIRLGSQQSAANFGGDAEATWDFEESGPISPDLKSMFFDPIGYGNVIRADAKRVGSDAAVTEVVKKAYDTPEMLERLKAFHSQQFRPLVEGAIAGKQQKNAAGGFIPNFRRGKAVSEGSKKLFDYLIAGKLSNFATTGSPPNLPWFADKGSFEDYIQEQSGGKVGNIGQLTSGESAGLGKTFKKYVENMGKTWPEVQGAVIRARQRLVAGGRKKKNVRELNNLQQNIGAIVAGLDTPQNEGKFTNKKFGDLVAKELARSKVAGKEYSGDQVNRLLENSVSWVGGVVPKSILDARSNITQGRGNKEIHYKIGKSFEKTLGALGGMFQDPGTEALDFSRIEGRGINVPKNVRKAIKYDAGTQFGDAEKGSGHGAPYFASKVINELAESKSLLRLSGFMSNNAIDLYSNKTFKTHPFVDFVDQGVDKQKVWSTTIGEAIRRLRPTAAKKIKNLIAKKYKKKSYDYLSDKEKKEVSKMPFKFNYVIDDLDIQNLEDNKILEQQGIKPEYLKGAGFAKNFKELSDLKAQVAARGFIPNFAKVRWSIGKNELGKKTYAIAGSDYDLRSFGVFLKEKGVNPQAIAKYQKRLKEMEAGVSEQYKKAQEAEIGTGRTGAKYYRGFDSVGAQEEISTEGLFIKGLGDLIKEFNRNSFFASGFIPNFRDDIDRLSNERGGFWSPSDSSDSEPLSQLDHFQKYSYGRHGGKLDLRSFFPKSGSGAIGNLFKEVISKAKAGEPFSEIDAGEVVGPRIPKMIVTAKKLLDRKRAAGLNQPPMRISGYFEPYDLFNTLGRNKRYYESEKQKAQQAGKKFEPSAPGKGIKKASLSSKYVPAEEKDLANSLRELGVPVDSKDERGGFKEFQRYYLSDLPLFRGGFARGFIPNYNYADALGLFDEEENEYLFEGRERLEGMGKKSDIFDNQSYERRSLDIGYLSSAGSSGPQIFKNLLKQIVGAAEEGKPYDQVNAGQITGPRIPTVILKAKRILDGQRSAGKKIPFMNMTGTMDPPARLLETLQKNKSKAKSSSTYVKGEEKELLQSFKKLGLNPKSWEMRDLDTIPMLKNFSKGFIPNFTSKLARPSNEFFIPGELGATIGNEKFTKDQVSKAILDAFRTIRPSGKSQDNQSIAREYISQINKSKKPFSDFVLNSKENFDGEDSQGNKFVPLLVKNVSESLKGIGQFSYNRGKYQGKKIGGPKLGRPDKERSFYGSMSASLGFIPNFANALQEAIGREKEALESQGSSAEIYVDQDNRLKDSRNPKGLLVANTRDEPRDGSQGVNRAIANNIDPKRHGAARGMIPNFISGAGIKGTGFQGFKADHLVNEHNKLVKALEGYQNLPDEEVDKLGEKFKKLKKQMSETKFSDKQRGKVENLSKGARNRISGNKRKGAPPGDEPPSPKKGMDPLTLFFAIQSGLQIVETAARSLVPAFEDVELSGLQFGSALFQMTSDFGKAGKIIGGVAVAVGIASDIYTNFYDEEVKLIKALNKDIEARKRQIDAISQNVEKVDKFASTLNKFGQLSGTGKIEEAGKVLQEILRTGGDISNIDPDGFNKLIDSINDPKAFQKAAEELKQKTQEGINTKNFQQDIAEAYADINKQIQDQEVVFGLANPFADAVDFSEVEKELGQIGAKLVGNLDDKQIAKYANELQYFDSSLQSSSDKITSLTGIFGELSPSLQAAIERTPRLADSLMEGVSDALQFENGILKAKEALAVIQRQTDPLNDKLNKLSDSFVRMADSSSKAIDILSKTSKIEADSRVEGIKSTKTVTDRDLILGKAAGEAKGAENLTADLIRNALQSFSADMLRNTQNSGITLSKELKPLIENIAKGGASPAEAIESLDKALQSPLTDPESKKIAQETLDKLNAINQNQVAGNAERQAQLQAQLAQLENNAIASLRNNVLSEQQLAVLSQDPNLDTAEGVQAFGQQIELLKPLLEGSQEGNRLLGELGERFSTANLENKLEGMASNILKINATGIGVEGVRQEVEKALRGEGDQNVNLKLVEALEVGLKAFEKAAEGGVADKDEVEKVATPIISPESISNLSTELSKTISQNMAGILEIPQEIANKINADVNIEELAQAVLTSSQTNEKLSQDYDNATKEVVKAMSQPIKGVDFGGMETATERLVTATENLKEAVRNINEGKASGFVPNFAPIDSISRAMQTESKMGAKRPVLDSHPSIGTYVRDGATQPNFAAVKRDHPEGLRKAVKNSRAIQSATNSRGFVPNFFKDYSTSELQDMGLGFLASGFQKNEPKFAKEKINAALFGARMTPWNERLNFSTGLATNAATIGGGLMTTVSGVIEGGKYLLGGELDMSGTKDLGGYTAKLAKEKAPPRESGVYDDKVWGPLSSNWIKAIDFEQITRKIFEETYSPEKYFSYFNNSKSPGGVDITPQIHELIKRKGLDVLKKIPSNKWGTRVVDWGPLKKKFDEMSKSEIPERVYKERGEPIDKELMRNFSRSEGTILYDTRKQLEMGSEIGSFFAKTLYMSDRGTGKVYGKGGVRYDTVLPLNKTQIDQTRSLLLGDAFARKDQDLIKRFSSTIPGGGDFIVKTQFARELQNIYDASGGDQLPVPLSVVEPGKDKEVKFGPPIITDETKVYNKQGLDNLISSISGLLSETQKLEPVVGDEEAQENAKLTNESREKFNQKAQSSLELLKHAQRAIDRNIKGGKNVFSRNPTYVEKNGIKTGDADMGLSFNSFKEITGEGSMDATNSPAPLAGKQLYGSILGQENPSERINKIFQSYYSSNLQDLLGKLDPKGMAKAGEDGIRIITEGRKKLLEERKKTQEKVDSKGILGIGKEAKEGEKLGAIAQAAKDAELPPINDVDKGVIQDIRIPKLDETAEKKKAQEEDAKHIRDKFYLGILTNAAEDFKKDPMKTGANFDEWMKAIETQRKVAIDQINEQLIPGYQKKSVAESEFIKKQIAALKKRAGTSKRSREFLQKKEKTIKERAGFYDKVLLELRHVEGVFQNKELGQAWVYFSQGNRPFSVDGKTISNQFFEEPENYEQRFIDLKDQLGIGEKFEKASFDPVFGGADGDNLSAGQLLAANKDLYEKDPERFDLAAQIRSSQLGNQGNTVGAAFERRYESLNIEGKKKLMQDMGLTLEDEKVNSGGTVSLPGKTFEAAKEEEDRREELRGRIIAAAGKDLKAKYYIEEALKNKENAFDVESVAKNLEAMGVPLPKAEGGYFSQKFNLIRPETAGIPFLDESDINSLMTYLREKNLETTNKDRNKRGIEAEGGNFISDLLNKVGEVKNIKEYPDYLNFLWQHGDLKVSEWVKQSLDRQNIDEAWVERLGSDETIKLINKYSATRAQGYGGFQPTESLREISKKIQEDPELSNMLTERGYDNNAITAARNIIGGTYPPKQEKIEEILSNTGHPFPELAQKAEGASNFIAEAERELESTQSHPFFPHGYKSDLARVSPAGQGVDAIKEFDQAMQFIKKKMGIEEEPNKMPEADNKEKGAAVARGFVPNFSKVAGEIAASKTAGYKNPVTASQVKNINIPGVGKSTYNTQESVFKAKGMSQPFIVPPSNSQAAKPYAKKVQKKFNFNPYGRQSADGFIPNFAPGVDGGQFNDAVQKFSDSVGIFERFGSTLQEAFSGIDFSTLSEASNRILEASKEFGLQSQNLATATSNFSGGGATNMEIDFSPLTDAAGSINQGVSKLSEQLNTPLSIDAGDLQTVVNDMKNINLAVSMPDVNVNVNGADAAANQIKNSVAQEVANKVRQALTEQTFVTKAQINSWFGTNF